MQTLSSAMLDFSNFISEHWRELLSLGLILEKWPRGLGLTGFFSLLIWKSTFLIFVKKDCIDYFQNTFQFF